MRTPLNRGTRRLGGMRRLCATQLRVGRCDFGVPRKDFGAQSIVLPVANLADEVVLLEGILSQVVVFFFLSLHFKRGDSESSRR